MKHLIIDNLEKWKPVVGYENKYEVSNFGNLRGIDRLISCHKVFKRRHKGILRKKSIDIGGYVTYSLSDETKKTVIRKAHVLVAKAFIPNLNNKPEVNHIDGNKQNNHVSNLEWVTRSENAKHAHLTGLVKTLKGEMVTNSKFTNEQVLEIFHSEEPPRLTAKKYGVHVRTIHSIKDGSNWSSVTGKKNAKPGYRRGENATGAVLNTSAALEIFRSTKTYLELSKQFGCAIGTIQAIKQGKTWKHVTQAA